MRRLQALRCCTRDAGAQPCFGAARHEPGRRWVVGSQTDRLLETREGVDFEWMFMTELDLSVPLQRSPNTVSVLIGETVVAVSIDAGLYFNLVGTGTRIWELLEQPIQPIAVMDVILAEFEVDELTGREETLAYLSELVEAGLVHPVE